MTRDTYLDQKPYLYCEHDPVNRVDPTGHEWDVLTKAGNDTMALGGIVAGIGILIPIPQAKPPLIGFGGILVGIGGMEYMLGRILPDEPWDWYSSAPKPSPIEQEIYFREIRQGRKYGWIPFPPFPIHIPPRRSDRWLTPKQ